MSYSIKHLKEAKEIINSLNYESIENIAKSLAKLKASHVEIALVYALLPWALSTLGGKGTMVNWVTQ